MEGSDDDVPLAQVAAKQRAEVKSEAPAAAGGGGAAAATANGSKPADPSAAKKEQPKDDDSGEQLAKAALPSPSCAL